MAVELLLHVTRSDDNRLNGTVRLSSESGDRPFSGTLELMRVFEELVPIEGVAATATACRRTPLPAQAQQRRSEERDMDRRDFMKQGGAVTAGGVLADLGIWTNEVDRRLMMTQLIQKLAQQRRQCE